MREEDDDEACSFFPFTLQTPIYTLITVSVFTFIFHFLGFAFIFLISTPMGSSCRCPSDIIPHSYGAFPPS